MLAKQTLHMIKLMINYKPKFTYKKPLVKSPIKAYLFFADICNFQIIGNGKM